MELTPQTLDDIMLYGGIFLCLVIVFFALGDDKQQKRAQRLKRASNTSSPADSHTALQQKSLRKEVKRDNIPIISLFTSGEKGFSHILRTRLETAGLELSVEKYIALNIIIMLVMFAIVSFILFKPLALGIFVGLAAGLGIPHLVVSRKISKRQKNFLLLFPDAIDLIVRGLRAGLPVTKSMQSVAEEINEPVKSVFRDISDQVTLGVTFEKALDNAAKKLNLTEFNFFITSIILQRETGGNLGEILSNLSEVLRGRQMMKMKIKAMSSEAKASAIIVGALPFVVFTMLNILSPEYIEPLYSDFRGNLAMMAAMGSLGLGAFIMSKLASFEI